MFNVSLEIEIKEKDLKKFFKEIYDIRTSNIECYEDENKLDYYFTLDIKDFAFKSNIILFESNTSSKDINKYLLARKLAIYFNTSTIVNKSISEYDSESYLFECDGKVYKVITDDNHINIEHNLIENGYSEDEINKFTFGACPILNTKEEVNFLSLLN